MGDGGGLVAPYNYRFCEYVIIGQLPLLLFL